MTRLLSVDGDYPVANSCLGEERERTDFIRDAVHGICRDK